MGPSTPRVAIVDDDVSLCRSLARLLRVAGYQPFAFHSAEQFLGDAQRASYDCVVVDVELGGMSGLELKRAMNARGDDTALVFLTAHDEPAVRTEAMQAGCAGFFSKTEDGSRILDVLRRITKS